jgi:hypothetical protein
MDECYWLGSGTFDVMDQAGSNHAESYNSAQPDTSDAIVNFSGGMGTSGYIQPETTVTIGNSWSFALWVKFPLDSSNHDDFKITGTNSANNYYYHALGSISGQGDLPTLLKENGGSDLMWDLYDANGNDTVADLPDNLNGWHHLVFVQNSSEIKLYLDGNYHNSVAATISGNVEAYLTSLDNSDGQTVGAKVDELKLWNRTLSLNEIKTVYQNEANSKNYDGSPRETVVCDASISAHSWELISIPADLRTESNTSISKILGDDMTGTYGTDWRIYKREYSDSNNSSWDTYLFDANTALEFGTAYWLGSKNAESWNVNDMKAVDYNSTNSACTAGTCVEIDLKSVSLNENTEDTNGTGHYRYYMTVFT